MIRILFLALLFGPFVGSVKGQEEASSAQERLLQRGDGAVYVVPVEGMIDNALARYIGRAVTDAQDAGAALIVFDIDTFGGLVDAADRIRKTILDATPLTIAYVNKNAASAGALISYACDFIVMAPGASIGAATVVEGVGGEAAPDKYQSYMRGLMRSTAEANGRDPRIAEAMVDETIEVEGVSEAGKVLTLSTTEAIRLKVADFEAETIEGLYDSIEVNVAAVVNHRVTRAEKVLRFFASPIMQSILMLMMLGGLYFELQTPGVGFPGLMALLGAAMFFAPHYMLGLVESWEIVAFVLGVGLIFVEIFLLPGFGIAGISGIILVVGALLAGLVGNVGLEFPTDESVSQAITTLAITLVLFVVLLFSLGRYLPKSERFGQLVLKPELASSAGYTAAEFPSDLVGAVGVTVTPLRPTGIAEFGGERYDVTSLGEYVPSGSNVVVRNVRGGRIEVRPVKPENETSAG